MHKTRASKNEKSNSNFVVFKSLDMEILKLLKIIRFDVENYNTRMILHYIQIVFIFRLFVVEYI